MPKPVRRGSGIASDSGSRSVRGQLGSNLRYEAASLQDLEHVRRERIETVDAAVREVDLTFAMSTSITSPAFTFRRNPGHSSTGSPRLIEFRKKIRANELARIADTPSVFSAIGACSRLDPHPKLSPATMRSPTWTLLAQAGSTASKACVANILESVVPRYFPAIMWSVEISSPNVQTRPRNCRCIRGQEPHPDQ